MDATRVDLKKVPFLHRDLPEQLIPALSFHHLLQLLLVPGMMADDDRRPRLTVQDVPALGLSQCPLFLSGRVSIVGMDLDAQVLPGVDELHQQRELIPQPPVCVAEQLRVVLPQLGQPGSLPGPP